MNEAHFVDTVHGASDLGDVESGQLLLENAQLDEQRH